MSRKTFALITFLAVLAAPAVASAQWVAPTATAPSGNVSSPLNVSATAQSKAGGLLLNTGGAPNGLIVQSGNVSFGTVTPVNNLTIKQSSNSQSTGGLAVVRSDTAGRTVLFEGGDDSTYLFNYGAGSLQFYTASTQVASLTTSGSTGNLHLYGSGGSAGYLYGDGSNFGLLNNAGQWIHYTGYGSQAVTFPGYIVAGSGGESHGQWAVTSGDFYVLGGVTSYLNGYVWLQGPGRGGTGVLQVDNSVDIGDPSAGGLPPNSEGDGSLYVYGSTYYWGGDNNMSDERLKTNITPITDAVSKIQQLNGVTFNWKSTGKPSVGVIAQNVEKVFPDLVTTDPKSGMKAVQYGNLVAPLIEAVKEQQKEIDDLKAEVQALQNK